jgi:inhibitor of cysteine peptidase
MKTIVLEILILSLFFAFVLSAPAADNTKDKNTDTIKLTVADKDKDIKTVSGKKIEIRLKGNATTGFQWRLVELKTEVLKADGKETYIPDKYEPPKTGVGGVYLFKFITGKPGKATVKLEYLRPWEKDTPPAEKFSVNIIVSEK